MAVKNLTVERLRERLSYDPTTGVLTWRDRATKGPDRTGMEAGGISGGNRYRMVWLDRGYYLTHRLVWLYVHGRWPEHTIDHINGDRLDNRISNLRDVPFQRNCENKSKVRAKSGLMGVKQVENGRWGASISYRNVERWIGTFDTPQEAHAAYIDAKLILHPGYIPSGARPS